MSTTARTRPPRTVDGGRSRRTPDPRPALSGLVAAGQALVLSLAVVVLPAVVAFLVSSSSGSGGGSGWGRSVTVGAGLWLLGHGVPLKSGGGLVTLVPLGVTALAVFACVASARRSAYATRSAWLTGAGAYGAVVLIVALVAGTTSGPGLAVAALGGTAVGAVGLGWGILARPDAPRVADLTARWDVLPAPLRVGLRGGTAGVALLVAVAGLLVVAWVAAGRATSQDIVAGLAPGVAGGAILAVAQATLVPNLVVWAAAWIAGPGFSIGPDTAYTVTATKSGTLPAVPLLGALPGEGWTNAVTALAPVLVVVLGVVVGAVAARRVPREGRITWAETGWVVLGVAAAAFALTGALAFLAGGSVGALADVGPNALLTGAVVAGELAVGSGIVLAWTAADVPAILARRPRGGDDEDDA